jgi:hypothetical protein
MTGPTVDNAVKVMCHRLRSGRDQGLRKKPDREMNQRLRYGFLAEKAVSFPMKVLYKKII